MNPIINSSSCILVLSGILFSCLFGGQVASAQKISWGPTAAYSLHHDPSLKSDTRVFGNYSFGLWMQNNVQRKFGFAISLEKGLENVRTQIDANTAVTQNFDYWKLQALVGLRSKRFACYAGFAPRLVSGMDVSLELRDKSLFKSYSYRYAIWNGHSGDPLRKFQLSPVLYGQYRLTDAFLLMLFIEQDIFSLLSAPLVIRQGLYDVILLSKPFGFNARYSRVGLRVSFLIPRKNK